jgi:uncharacterized membrane protein YeaQ/YmgE (transglycosylase-associated protein family)
MGTFLLGTLSFIGGALLLLIIAGLCTWLAAALIKVGSDTAAVMFLGAFVGSILGHYFMGAWGPSLLEIYFVPAILGAFGGMILSPFIGIFF